MCRVRNLGILACLLFCSTSVEAKETSINSLVSALSKGDQEARLEAIDALGQGGAGSESAVSALAAALSDPAPLVRQRAARALGMIGPAAKSAIVALSVALEDKDPHVRAYVVHAMGKIGVSDEVVLKKLIMGAFDKEAIVRRATLRAVRRIEPPAEITRPIFIKMLEESDPSTVAATLESVAAGGKKIVPRLCEALKHEKASYWACLVLAQIGPDAEMAVPHLQEVLKHEHPEVRIEALVALGEIGPAAAPAAKDIVPLLESDEIGGVRYAAAYALASIGQKDVGKEALLEASRAEDSYLSMISAWALAKIYPEDTAFVRSAAQKIVKGLKSDDEHVRRTAARGLADFKEHSDITGPALVEALRDADPDVTDAAIEALASLGPKIVPRVASRLTDPDLRVFALRLLQRLGPKAEAAVPAIVEQLRADGVDEELEFRASLQITLGLIGPEAKAAVPVLVESLASDDEDLRSSACYALAKIGKGAAAAVPTLREGLDSDDAFIQLSSAWALLEIMPGDRKLAKRTVPLLIGGLENEREGVRAEAARTLGGLGALAEPAIGPLKKLLKDESAEVRQAAETALTKLPK